MGDLILARAGIREVDAPARGTAFFAQQALEKGLKGVLVWHQIDFPHTHDLAALGNLIPSESHLGLAAIDLGRISDFAVDTRYPIDDWSEVLPVTNAEAETALATVTSFLDRILEHLVAQGMPLPDKPE